MKRGHGDPLANRCLERTRIRLEVRDDRIARHEPVRIFAGIRAAGKKDGPVRGDEAERVPASAPGLADSAALQHEVINTGSRQLVAHRETGLPRTDHDDVWFAHRSDSSGALAGRS